MKETNKIKTSADYRDGSRAQEIMIMYENGSTPNEIQEFFGYKSNCNIYNVLNKSGIHTGRKYSIDHIDHNQLIEMKLSGMTNAAISRELKISTTSVSNILARNGYKSERRIEKSEEQLLPIPEIEEKVFVFPKVTINGIKYIDVTETYM